MNDHILLDDMRFNVVLGVLEREQRTAQPVDVKVRLELNLDAAGDDDDLTRTVDYALIQSQVEFLLSHGRWRLLETFAVGMARLLLAPPVPEPTRAQVDAVEIQITKPTILDCGVPGVRIRRPAPWCVLESRFEPPGSWLDVLVETASAGAYRILVEPGTAYRAPQGMACEVMHGTANLEGRTLRVRDRIARSSEQTIWNRSTAPMCLLAVSHPPLPP